jgi:hypothetical protein
MVIHPIVIFEGKSYYFNNIFGILFSRKTKKDNALDFISKTKNFNVDVVKNPYLARKLTSHSTLTIKPSIVRYAKFLVWLTKHCYFLAIKFTKLKLGLFEDATVANSVFYKIIQGNQQELCLPRSIFIASTSKQFAKKGSLFIGVYLPTHNMHAWIIEDGIFPNRFDSLWTDYTPILILE